MEKIIRLEIKPFRHVSKFFEINTYTGNFRVETPRCFSDEFTALNYVFAHLGGVLFFKILELLHHSEMDHIDFFTKHGEKVTIYPQS